MQVRGLSLLSSEDQVKFNASLDKLPSDISDALARQGVTIEVMSRVRSSESGRIDYGGQYRRSTRTVEISAKGLGHPDSDVLLHEIGHAWDHILGDVSKSPAYRSLAREAKPQVPYYKKGSPGNSTGGQELFAEGFAQYFGGYVQPSHFTLTDNMKIIFDELRHNIHSGEDV